MITKYNFEVPNDVVDSNVNRLTNQLWKLIPMREKKENWLGQLGTVTDEIAGLGAIFAKDVEFLVLLSKLEGLKTTELEFGVYRKTIFESISLLRELMRHE